MENIHSTITVNLEREKEEKRRTIRTPRIFNVDFRYLREAGVSQYEIKRYLPRYLLESTEFHYNWIGYYIMEFFRLFLISFAKLALRPRKGKVGELDLEEVREVYDKEAKSYDLKHHITTRGQDTVWRRWVAGCIATLARQKGRIKILDLCTGTGLTIKEISNLLKEWGARAEITGLDYSQKMLEVAKRKKLSRQGIPVHFVRGNAMDLVNGNHHGHGELVKIPKNSVDVVTQMFGIGGIKNPLLVFKGVIQILKSGGQFILTDMHQPVANQPGEFPLLFKWLKMPGFESVAYNKSTIPVVLNRLWGWRDTTSDFYVLPLVTWQDENGNFWGFKVINFETESQRWWFSVPIMPIGKMIAEKEMIEKDEYDKRRKILSSILS